MATTKKQRRSHKLAATLDDLCRRLRMGKSREADEVRAADRRLEKRKRAQMRRVSNK